MFDLAPFSSIPIAIPEKVQGLDKTYPDLSVGRFITRRKCEHYLP